MATPVKNRKRESLRVADAPEAVPADVMDESEIARRAYEIHVARGYIHGHDLEDWLQAERELHDHSTHAR